MKFFRSIQLAPLAALLAVACATTGANQTVTVTPLNGLSIGIVNYGGASNADSESEALKLYLTQKLGRDVATKVFVTEPELSEAVAAGKVDLAWMPPFAFVEAQKKGQVTPLAKIVRHGLPFYRSVLFVKSSSPATTPKDLVGAKAAWVEKNSAAGYLFPRAVVIQAGLKPKDLFKSETFYGDHAAVCNAVLTGQADVGATFADDRGTDEMQIDGCVQSAGDSAKSLRIIAKSSPIPNDVIAARPGFSSDDAKRVKDMLLGLGPGADDAKLLGVFKADSFQDVGEDDFEPVRFAADAATK